MEIYNSTYRAPCSYVCQCLHSHSSRQLTEQFTFHANAIYTATMKSVQLLNVCTPIGMMLFRQGMCHIKGVSTREILRSGE